MLGKVVIGDKDPASIEQVIPDDVNLVDKVSCKSQAVFNEEGSLKILCVDCGIKRNQIRCLVNRGASVTVVPWNTDITTLVSKFDGLFISNGPGSPEHCAPLIEG